MSIDKTKPIFDSRESEQFELYNNCEDTKNESDFDVNEFVDNLENIDDGINEDNFNFMEV